MENQLLSTAKPGAKAIVLSGLIVGTLDILAAIIDFYVSTGKNPSAIFKYIASAVMGMDAFAGGTAVILLGLLLHYIIAFLFTILFYFLYYRFAWMRLNKILIGIGYGVFIWAVMNRIVVPLSLTPKANGFVIWKAVKAASILIFMIGIPLSFLAARFYKKTNAANS
ncbi:MAG TPA: hypothetical protein VFF27_02700 [Bacteroidia bacterium]|nr:hypothetical protein [Bacteroidia bacterium]